MKKNFRVFAFLFLSFLILNPISSIATSGPQSFAPVVEKLLPAVVNISTTTIIKQRRYDRRRQFPQGHPFEEFFKEFNERHGGSRQRKKRGRAGGSGFVIDPSGLIVTNNHVIEDAEEIQVTFQNDLVLDAKVIGRDEKTDLALLKVESDKPLPYVKWGNSDIVRVGDWVLAIGNPFGLGGTVTSGIVSARARVLGTGPYDDFIQTDASINKGNSGGPMFNTNGEVIGINTAIYSPSGGNVGIGFAIPSNMAKIVIDQLNEYGVTKRGWIGVVIQEISPEIAETLELKETQGALISKVEKASPADKAGVKAGDVILSFDGQKVKKMRDLPRIVVKTAIGKKVKLVVWRDKQEKTLELTVGQRAEDIASLEKQKHQDGNETHLPEMGISLASATSELKQLYDIKDDFEGVVVTDVTAGSGAARRGIDKGDILLQINQKDVNKPSDAVSIIKAAKDRGRSKVLVLVYKNQSTLFVAVPIK